MAEQGIKAATYRHVWVTGVVGAEWTMRAPLEQFIAEHERRGMTVDYRSDEWVVLVGGINRGEWFAPDGRPYVPPIVAVFVG